jgi:soluble cytochrome b562
MTSPLKFVLASGLALAVPTLIIAQSEQWAMKMDDAQDAKDTLQDAVSAKNAKDAGEQTAKMIAILTETKKFWADQKMPDIVKIADDNLAALNEMAAMAKSGKMDGAQAGFDKINTTCSACHDIHPENRLKK